MENSLLPCDEWTVLKMRNYIRDKKLNKTKIVLLGMKRVDMIEGLKKLKHFQLPSNEIVSKLGCDVSHLHNIIWDIEEMIVKYLDFYRHISSLNWGQLSEVYRTNYHLKYPGLTCKITRHLTCKITRNIKPLKLSKLILKDLPGLTIDHFPKSRYSERKHRFCCLISLYEESKELMYWMKWMLYYYGWKPHRSYRGYNNNQNNQVGEFYKFMGKSTNEQEEGKILVNILYVNNSIPSSNIHTFRISREPACAASDPTRIIYHNYLGEDDRAEAL